MAIDWLPHDELDSMNGEPAYAFEKLSAKFEVIRIHSDGWLVLNWDKEKFWLKFAAMDFFYSDGDNINLYLKPVFYGDGPTGNLREFRHTYWGDDGYMFYANKKTIVGALELLSKYYDFD